MKQIDIKVLGIPAKYSVTDSVVEFDALAKKPGSAHEEAVANRLYRGPYADFREGLCEAIEEDAKDQGFTRHSRVEKTKEGKDRTVIEEYPDAFIKRALASNIVTREQLGEWLQGMADDAEYAFAKYLQEPDRRAKGPSAARVTKRTAQYIDSVIAAGKADKLAALLSQKLGRTVETDALSLGLAVEEDTKRENERRRAEMASAIDSL